MNDEPIIPFVANLNTTEKPPKAETEDGVVLKKFYPEEVETILSVFAWTGGNAPKTSRILQAENNISVHPITIKRMAREQFPVKYAEIQETLGSRINSIATGRVGELVLKGTDVQSNLLDRIDKRLDEEDDIPIKDLAPAFRNVAQATKDNLMQKQLLENKPTAITEVRTIEEAIKELEDDDIVIDVDVVSEETLPQEDTGNEKKSDTDPANIESDPVENSDQPVDIPVTHQNETIEDFPF